MKRLLLPTWFAVALLGGAVANASAPEAVGGATVCEDAELVAAVRTALRWGVGPEAVETLVGRPATFNTTRDQHQILGDLKCAGDSEGQAVAGKKIPPRPDWKKAKQVVFWERPLNRREGATRMVGIAWDEDDRATVFFLVVSPP